MKTRWIEKTANPPHNNQDTFTKKTDWADAEGKEEKLVFSYHSEHQPWFPSYKRSVYIYLCGEYENTCRVFSLFSDFFVRTTTSICVWVHNATSLNYQSEYIVLFLLLFLSRDPNGEEIEKKRKKQRAEWTLTGKSVSQKAYTEQQKNPPDNHHCWFCSLSFEEFFFFCSFCAWRARR